MKGGYLLGETIVAIATGEVYSAIGIVRLSGQEAISIVSSLFRGKDLTQVPSHTVHYGKILSGTGSVLDEVVVTIFRAPRSYTREDVVEISCHGNPFILRKVVEACIRKGARLAQPGEFTLRAFLNGSIDLSQAEAVADLIYAQSEKAHDIALNQLKGNLSSELKSLRNQLIDFTSLLELELDFSEEDVEFANRSELVQLLGRILSRIEVLLSSFSYGNALKEGIATVIAGRPNAGKSSLLNLLVGEERAIVSDIAGTTRDTIEAHLNLKGFLFRFVDTAGIRKQTHDTIEHIGIQKAMEKIQQSPVLLYVFDASVTSEEDVLEDLKTWGHSSYVVLVANKGDLVPEYRFSTALCEASAAQVLVSAKMQTGIEGLKQALLAYAEAQYSTQDTVLTNARHYEALWHAQQAIQNVLQGMQEGISSEFISQDLRVALYHLGTLTGEISNDEILGNIFSKFCIGK